MDSNPFSTSNIVTIADQGLPELGYNGLESLENEVFKVAQYDAAQLPDLSNDLFKLQFDDVDLSDLDSSRDSFSTAPFEREQDTNIEHAEVDETVDQDIWALPDLRTAGRENKLVSWDCLQQECRTAPETGLMSELPSTTFDAIIRADQKTDPSRTLRYARPNVFLNALIELALGYDSVFFRWEEKAVTFVTVFEDFTVSGFSMNLLKELILFTSNIGSRMRILRFSVHLGAQVQKCALRHALYSVLSECLQRIEEHIQISRSTITTPLQLRFALEKTDAFLEMIHGILDCAKSFDNNGALLQRLVNLCSELGRRDPGAEPLISEVVRRSFEPLLKSLWVSVGLLPDVGMVSPSLDVATLGLTELANLATACRDAVQLLRNEKSCHEVLDLLAGSDCPAPSIIETWSQATEARHTALHFEKQCKDRLQSQDGHGSERVDGEPVKMAMIDSIFGTINGADIAFHPVDFTTAKQTWSNIWCQHRSETNPLQDDMALYLGGHSQISSGSQPDIYEAIETSILPFLRVQHRLLSFTLLRSLFQEHRLKDHISLQYRFQLLGDGLFTAQLSRTLFDSDEASGDSGRSTNTTIGLRLQARETWPPASSELRLALMGIMSQSLQSEPNTDLSDSISFAIRELDDTELELCLDKDSIHALDFLCIRYTPSSSLITACITTESLEMYDRVFKFLLLVTRVHSTTQKLVVESLKNGRKQQGRLKLTQSVYQMHQFVNTIADFCHNVAIRTHWHQFETLINEADDKVTNGDYDGILETAKSLEYLRHKHEQMLNDILQDLFLKRKQADLNGTILNIFNVILKVAAMPQNPDASDQCMALVEDFRDLVAKLVCALKEHGHDIRSRSATTSGVSDRLQMMLDSSDYWSSRKWR